MHGLQPETLPLWLTAMTGPSDSETHIEWLAHIVLHADRRRTPFNYARPRG